MFEDDLSKIRVLIGQFGVNLLIMVGSWELGLLSFDVWILLCQQFVLWMCHSFLGWYFFGEHGIENGVALQLACYHTDVGKCQNAFKKVTLLPSSNRFLMQSQFALHLSFFNLSICILNLVIKYIQSFQCVLWVVLCNLHYRLPVDSWSKRASCECIITWHVAKAL